MLNIQTVPANEKGMSTDHGYNLLVDKLNVTRNQSLKWRSASLENIAVIV